MAKSRSKGTMNVYTLMTFVAFVTLLAACAYVGWRNVQLTGTEAGYNPFYIEQANSQ